MGMGGVVAWYAMIGTYAVHGVVTGRGGGVDGVGDVGIGVVVVVVVVDEGFGEGVEDVVWRGFWWVGIAGWGGVQGALLDDALGEDWGCVC